MPPISCFIAFYAIVFILDSLLTGSAPNTGEVERLLNRMETAYAGVINYRMQAEVRNYSPDGSFQTKIFLYTFQKPNRIRIDFKRPHPGMVMVYPAKNGKVLVWPFKWAPSFKLYLSPDSFMLKNHSGQQIDQTDLGLLIRNISSSLTQHRRGPLQIVEKNGSIEIRVLADDHFRAQTVTRYRFIINKKRWLPAGVVELTKDRTRKRSIYFRNLRVNIRISNGFFRLNGG